MVPGLQSALVPLEGRPMMTWLGVNSGRIGGEGAFFSLVPETSHDRVKLSLPERWRGSRVLTCLLLSQVGGHLGVMNMVGMAVFFFFYFKPTSRN